MSRLNRTLVIGLLLLATVVPSVRSQSHESWSYNLGMYEVNVRQYTPEGTFDAFAAHLDRLEDLGVGILWFMPIHPIGQQNRLGSRGSYYSVRDYLGVNPEFGTLEDFKALVDEAHERGMYVLMDWVANHTAWDNVLTQSNPEWYVTDNSGNFIPPPGTNWSDVIELDFSQPGLRAYMIDAMKWWVEEVGVDGFRFDAVDFVPEDFWLEATAALTSARSDLLLLAEGDDPRYNALGFHMTFGWRLYGFEGGVLKRVADGEDSAGDLYAFAGTEASRFGDAYRLYFTSNHDENSWSGTPRELFGDAAEAFAVLTGTFRGMPLIYSGQEAGLDRRLAFFDKDLIPWREHPYTDLYRTLLELKRENPALWNGPHGGRPRRAANSNEAAVFSVIRERDGYRVLAAFNVTGQPQTATFTGSEIQGSFRDVFGDSVVTIGSDFTVDFDPWGYRVLAASPEDTGYEDESPSGDLRLYQNHPNPFSDRTQISFSLAEPSFVSISITDLLGREVQVIRPGSLPVGHSVVEFDGSGLSSGVYVYRLTTEDQTVARRMVRVR